jgi:hypothetical protein
MKVNGKDKYQRRAPAIPALGWTRGRRYLRERGRRLLYRVVSPFRGRLALKPTIRDSGVGTQSCKVMGFRLTRDNASLSLSN